MRLRVVAIEDESDSIDEIEESLRAKISDRQKNRYGIESVDLEIIDSKEGALELLQRLALEGTSPDVIIVDLQIPRVPVKEGGVANVRFGIELLREARMTFADAEILIYSAWDEYELSVKSFSGGAIDFMRKSAVTGSELLDRVLAAGARVLARQNTTLLEQRLKDLVPYAETGLAHRLGVCFSRFVQSVVNESEGLEEGLKERWGLDVQRDAQDPQVRHLIEVQEAVRHAKKEWTEIVASLVNSGDEAADCVIEDALKQVHAELMPSLSLNGVRLNGNLDGRTIVRTFRNGSDDVKAVLKEIVLGGLSEPVATENLKTVSPDEKGGEKKVDIDVRTNDGQAEIQFRDSLVRIDHLSSEKINKGIIIPPGESFGRAWGLSVAQHLAQRGGGKLKVSSNGSANVITYTIPLADHAKSSAGR